MNFTDKLKSEYTRLIETMVIRPEWKDPVDRKARAVLANKDRYVAVSDALGGNIPWYFIGAIHSLESNLTFDTALHNGDKIIGTNKKTYRVPKGRGPFETWESSAIDALTIKKLDEIEEWSAERLCYELERYNGFGYRKYHPSVLSPYLWSGSLHYTRGKYVEDGKWSASARSAQTGAWPLIQRIREIDVSKREVVQQSSRLTLLTRIRDWFAGISLTGIVAETLDLLKPIKEFVVDNKYIFVGVTIGGVLFVLQKVLRKSISEYKEGRYIPSGQKEDAE